MKAPDINKAIEEQRSIYKELEANELKEPNFYTLLSTLYIMYPEYSKDTLADVIAIYYKELAESLQLKLFIKGELND